MLWLERDNPPIITLSVWIIETRKNSSIVRLVWISHLNLVNCSVIFSVLYFVGVGLTRGDGQSVQPTELHSIVQVGVAWNKSSGLLSEGVSLQPTDGVEDAGEPVCHQQEKTEEQY